MGISTAIDASAVARVIGIKAEYKDLREGGVLFLPQRIALIGQGATASTFSTAKTQHTNAFSVGNTYGFGSPLHLAALQLFPKNGDGIGSIPLTVYPLEDADTGVVAAGDITPSGVQSESAQYVARFSGIESLPFVIAAGQSVADTCAAMVAAINAVVEMPVIAVDGTTKVTFTTKWKGLSANAVVAEVIGSTTAGTSFAFTQAVGGLVDPDVQDALDLVGNVWETLIVNCLDLTNTSALDDYSTFGESRWGALVKKPCIVFTGSSIVTAAANVVITDARKSDRTNCIIPLPGSVNLPCVIAASAVKRIAVRANNNPPFDYAGLALTGLIPGDDGDQWLDPDRNVAVKGGCSTVEIEDSVALISDTVTCYHPSGDPLPAYRYVVDIVKLMNIIFNIDLIFNTDAWKGAPLIPDDEPTVNPAAKQPKGAKAAMAGMLTSLALNAIISDSEYAINNTDAAINDLNPKRLDVATTVKLSGNTNIISIDLNFGFYFG